MPKLTEETFAVDAPDGSIIDQITAYIERAKITTNDISRIELYLKCADTLASDNNVKLSDVRDVSETAITDYLNLAHHIIYNCDEVKITADPDVSILDAVIAEGREFGYVKPAEEEEQYFAICYDGKKDVHDSSKTAHELAEMYMSDDDYLTLYHADENDFATLTEEHTDEEWLEYIDGSFISAEEAVNRIAHLGWRDCGILLLDELEAAKEAASERNQELLDSARARERAMERMRENFNCA